MGLHAIDSVRRDAAEQTGAFETQLLAGGREAQVTVLAGKTKLVYTIDIEADLVRRIDLWAGAVPVGTLEFEYLQDAGEGQSEFTAPSIQADPLTLREGSGILWLVRLADGTLGG